MNIKRLAYYPLSSIYKILCLMAPTNKIKLVFISYPDAADNSWHLYRYIAKNLSGYKLIWLCSNPKAVENKIRAQAGITSNTVKILKKNSLIGFFNFFTAKYVFHTHGTFFFTSKSRGPTVINLWHGMPIKVISFLDNKQKHEVAYSDFTISTSEYYSGVMAKAFSLDKSQVIQSGLPRNDVLIRPIVEQKEVFHKLKLPNNSRLVFWLPTYRASVVGDIRKDSSSSSFLADWGEGFLERLNHAAKKEKLHIIIKIHPMDQLNKSPGLPIFERVKIIKSHEWEALGLDLYDALSHSSALVTDISSVLIDYISTQKPIGIIEAGINDYLRLTVPGLNTSDLMGACYKISSEEGFYSFLKNMPLCQGGEVLARLNSNNSLGETACHTILSKTLLNNHH